MINIAIVFKKKHIFYNSKLKFPADLVSYSACNKVISFFSWYYVAQLGFITTIQGVS